ncbi:MAG: ribonuclease P protein component [Gammaproteobacteria bacterium]|nr:ribonuclease P protein component [Rhodocyclaceae bacterium]MBU3907734.1 ribonuclease P protein component [Gammaproteobacteria bacterium]MBU3989834.1 ribonuclease P protein component [Gammaproteobacteria bacterium]MBU4004380.1 ribonuclease P protein component [Gammaproteobacteria bacterium]MBU4019789.1 ribonuclease P protein component [Gammaproteobacteria bacterium]
MSGSAVSAENFGFDRQLRLRVAAEFSEVFAARRVLRGACFALHYRPNDKPHARLGLVIPKKQARDAVLRNAIKRQARELFRLRRAGLPPIDLVLRLARPLDPAGPARRVIDPQARAAWRTEIGALFDQLQRNSHRSAS